MDIRDQLIARVVPGRSFADVGGLWGTVNEKVSVAAQTGATEVTMLDASTPDSPWWPRFDERMTELGIEKYRNVIGDATDPAVLDEVGPVDVVHCAGVLYHLPNPMALLSVLRQMTTSYVILTSAVTPRKVGRVKVPASGVLFIPALSDSERRAVARYWRSQDVEAGGITEPADYRTGDFAPWWFLPTVEALRAMCETAGFVIEGQYRFWNGNASTLLLTA